MKRPPLLQTPRTLTLAVLIGLLWLRLYQPPNIVDDAYITFRYARNLIEGHGLVYNPGERVLGTTAPAYAALLAFSSQLSGLRDFPQLALFINTLCNALAACVLYRLVTRLTRNAWAGFGAAVLLTLDGRLLDFSTGGMESSANVLIILLTLLMFFEGRTVWAAALAGLSILIRPDGAMLAAALFVALGWPMLRQRNWRLGPWKELLAFSAIVGPWVLFAWSYYGTPIPHTVIAKSVAYRLPTFIGVRAFLVQLRTLFPFSLPPLQDPEPLWRQGLQAVLPLTLCVAGLIALQRHHPRAWFIGLYAALFIAFFSIGNPLWLGWYEIPMTPVFQMLVLAVMLWIPAPRVGTVLSLGLTALMAVPNLSRLNALPWETASRPAFTLNPTFNKDREAEYALFARMLAPAATNDRRVAIPEIGSFGYTYRGRLFDTTGLISPAALPYFPVPAEIPIEIYSVPPRMLTELRPDLFIAYDSFIQATLPLDDADFLARYRPTLALSSRAAFGVQRLVAYRRADLPIEVTLPIEATEVSVRIGPEALTLAGYHLTFIEEAEAALVDVKLFWRAGALPITHDLLIRVRLLDLGGNTVYEILNQPGEQLLPTPEWTPGMWVVDRYRLKRPVPDGSPYAVTVTVFTSDSEAALTATSRAGQNLVDNTIVIPNLQP
jgi:hypothetical protein